MYNLTFEASYPTPFSSQFLYFLLLSMSDQKHTPDTTTDIQDAYDYIVVGAGSAGSVVASRLAEKECVTVLLLEAGKSPPKLTDLPVLSTSYLGTDLDWHFNTVPQKHSAEVPVGKTLVLHAGKTMGGSSTVNGMQSIRGNKKDYDSWVEQGATGWSYEDVLPYFKKLEDTTNLQYAHSGYRGVGGPVTMTTPPYESELELAVYEAAKIMGYSIVDSNSARQSGFNLNQANMRQGQRCGTAKAYLVPNEHKTNLDIVEKAYVKKVLISNGQAEGVEFDFKGQTREVRARREVILSAGTIKSSHILMLSGVGPGEELKKHKIPVVADLPVGRSLQEHWGVLMDFELDDKIHTFNEKRDNFFNIWAYIHEKTGPLASQTASTNMAFIHKDLVNDPYDNPTYQLYWGEGIHPTAKSEFTTESQLNESINNSPREKPFYWCMSQLLHPKARGVVLLNSTDPYDSPLIDPMYFSHPEDLEFVVAGMKKCNEIGASDALRKIGSKPMGTEYPGCPYAASEDTNFRCIENSVTISCNHQVGTVKMGRVDDPMTVVDPQLRVKSIGKLRVVDASVMPSIIGGNTNVPTMMIAEKASDMIKESIQCPPQTFSI